ncbi:MAG: DMT family transporter [Burkholderiales bacterium]|nr:MAG: DMT family transporter [Burkholderiales bacterium]
MRRREAVDLVLLAAIWGSSFLFIRIAAPAFGPVALVEVRLVSGALVLLPLVAAAIGLGALRRHARRFALIGAINFAVPFVLTSYAMLTLTAAFTSMLNGTVPMWTALIAALWFGERVRPVQWLGLAVGALGVLVLVGDKIHFDRSGAGWTETVAVGAALLGMMCYGLSANVAKRTLAGVPPLATAAGSQIAAAALLAPAALLTWPAQVPAAGAWTAAIVLGVLCTGLAHVLYFRLIERIGAMRAANVTYLIPLFATLWGSAFLAEPVTVRLLAGGAIVLAGTALALGVFGRAGRPG